MKKESYLIEGMSCSGCQRAVQKAVANVEGVASADVSLEAASITLEYDPHKTTIDAIKTVIGRIGYKLADQLPADGQRQGNDEAVS